jgi:hypothetical protein
MLGGELVCQPHGQRKLGKGQRRVPRLLLEDALAVRVPQVGGVQVEQGAH